MGKVITFKHRGNFLKTLNFFRKAPDVNYVSILRKYGKIGVDALSSATPVRTGKTASSWHYEIIEEGKHTVSIVWSNSNINKGVNIALIIQYGHGTRQGGYVEGIDYINPSIKPVFDDISRRAWEEVSRL